MPAQHLIGACRYQGSADMFDSFSVHVGTAFCSALAGSSPKDHDLCLVFTWYAQVVHTPLHDMAQSTSELHQMAHRGGVCGFNAHAFLVRVLGTS
jgi:hypothetical protein